MNEPKRQALSDEQWAWVELVATGFWRGRGRPSVHHHRTLNAIAWVGLTGRPWRELPAAFGPWNSAYRQFLRWTKDGLWDRIDTVLLLVEEMPQDSDPSSPLGLSDVSFPRELIGRRLFVSSLPMLSAEDAAGLRRFTDVARAIGTRAHAASSRLRRDRLASL